MYSTSVTAPIPPSLPIFEMGVYTDFSFDLATPKPCPTKRTTHLSALGRKHRTKAPVLPSAGSARRPLRLAPRRSRGSPLSERTTSLPRYAGVGHDRHGRCSNGTETKGGTGGGVRNRRRKEGLAQRTTRRAGFLCGRPEAAAFASSCRRGRGRRGREEWCSLRRRARTGGGSERSGNRRRRAGRKRRRRRRGRRRPHGRATQIPKKPGAGPGVAPSPYSPGGRPGPFEPVRDNKVPSAFGLFVLGRDSVRLQCFYVCEKCGEDRGKLHPRST